MGKRCNTLENCSASADVEATTDPSKNGDQIGGERVGCNPKKQKKQSKVDGTSDLQKETKEMKYYFQEMVEATRKLVDLMPTKADLDGSLLETSDKEEKTWLKKESDADEEKETDEDEKTALKKEIVEMTNSLKEMSDFVKKQQENMLTKADLLKLTPFKEKKEKHACCFETEGAFKNHEQTIFVSGFGCSLRRGMARMLLRKHFRPYGRISSVFVPMECKTEALLGFAFINLMESEQALKLDGSLMGSCKLHVVMAKTRDEYYYYENFAGCERCTYAINKRRRDDWIKTCGGLCSYPLVP